MTLARVTLFERLFPDWREVLWDILESTEVMHGEDVLYTFQFKVSKWGLKLPVSFTFRVKHLRFIAERLAGSRPAAPTTLQPGG